MAFLLLGLGFIGLGTAFVVEGTKTKKENKVLNFAYGTNRYTEEKRGNMMYKKYPPCYDICGATRTIQDKLEDVLKDKFVDYSKLLDIFSIVLCQEVYVESKNKDEMLRQRINDLVEMGAKITQQDKSIAKTQEMTTFLSLSKNLIQRQVKMLLEDNRIDKDTKKEIVKLTNIFYDIHYSKLERY